MFVLAACLVSLFFGACQKEEKGSGGEIPPGELWVVRSSGSGSGVEDIKEALFTDNDMKSFRSSTGEIVFNDLTTGEIEKRLKGEDAWLTYYLGDVRLFDSVRVVPRSSSLIYNDLVFVMADAGCYLLSGYPSLDGIEYKKEEHRQLREKNAFIRQKSWDIFIRYLQKKGKLEK